MALRYFNAAGCDAEGELGERHDPETHLVPLVLREALRVRSGGNPAFCRRTAPVLGFRHLISASNGDDVSPFQFILITVLATITPFSASFMHFKR